MNQLKPATIGFDRAWLLVDPLTVDQAAALWCGREPESKMLRSSELKDPKLTAVRQMLVSAVKAGVLPAELRLGAFAMGWFGEALVTRDALRKFANSKQQSPEFLRASISATTSSAASISPEPETTTKKTLDRRASKRTQRERKAVKVFLIERYPNGIPSEKTNSELHREACKELSRPMSLKTVIRARRDLERSA